MKLPVCASPVLGGRLGAQGGARPACCLTCPTGGPHLLPQGLTGPPHHSMQSDFTSSKPWVRQARVRVPAITSSPGRAAEGAAGTLPQKHQLRSQVAHHPVLSYQAPPWATEDCG